MHLSQTFRYQDRSEAVAQGCTVKKVFLEISQSSQENTCARVCFLIKLQGWGIYVHAVAYKKWQLEINNSSGKWNFLMSGP